MLPLFSVIIPTYNRKDFLPKAIDSVLSQTFKDFEFIIIDDGSIDETKKLVFSYNDRRITYVYQENHGVAHARNRGLEKAKGEWIAFLDSDDWWLPQKLVSVSQSIDCFRDFQVFHTEEIWYRHGDRLNQKKVHKKRSGYIYPHAVKLCCISISTAVLHKSVFEDIGVFDETLPVCEDYDFWLRATAQYPVHLIDEHLTEKEGGHKDQLSSLWGLDRYRIQSLVKMLRSGILKEEDYEQTRREMLKKAKVYINGCRKRNRWNEVDDYSGLIAPYELLCEDVYANS